MGKKSTRKPPQLIKGSNVGYDITEIQNTSTSDLRNILDIIYFYFTKRSRQKTKNSNFRNLYIRIKHELNEREKTENCRKVKFSISEINDEIKFDNFQTQLEEVTIPNFLNDQKNVTSTNNSTPSISTTSFDEDIIKEEIEKLKQQKIALLIEMRNLKKKCNNENKKEEEKGIENEFNSIFYVNKNQDLNFDFEPNLFINSENNSVCNN